MAITHTTTWKCDICGKELTEPSYDAQFPRTWGYLNFGDYYYDEVDFCDECSKKTFVFAICPGNGNSIDTQFWLVDDEQIKSLAAGVPAEDIFV